MSDSIERRIAVGVLYSVDYVSRIINRIEIQLLRSNEVRTIVNFAFDVFRKVGAVIGDEVGYHVDLYLPDSDEKKEIIFAFIDSIDDSEKEINVDVLYYDTINYLAQRKIELFTSRVQSALDNADIETAKRIINDFSVPEDVQVEENVILSPDVINEIFESTEPIIKFEGQLGKLINRFLIRSSFLAILAPEKRGKSRFLIEFAMRGVKNGLNVAYFEAGDNSLNEIRKRFLMYVLGRPLFPKRDLMLPVFDCVNNQRGCSLPWRKNTVNATFVDDTKIDYLQSLENGYQPCIECINRKNTPFPVSAFLVPANKKQSKPITKEEALEVAKVWDSIISKYGGSLKLFAFPSMTLTVSGINEILKGLESSENWKPDVIIIDYADILATESRVSEQRHRINDMWLRLRRLSLEWDVLLVTATQSDVLGHKTKLLDQQRFSEDKRKMAHVTAMIGLNQEPHEKRVGLMRINVIVAREDEYDVEEVAHVLTGYQIGKPILKILEE